MTAPPPHSQPGTASDLADYIERGDYVSLDDLGTSNIALIVAALRTRSGVQIARPTDSELLGVLNAAIVALKSRDQNSFEMKVLDGLKVAMAQLEASSSLSSADHPCAMP